MSSRAIAKWVAPLIITAVVVLGARALQRRTPTPDGFDEALAALRAGNLDRVAAIEQSLDIEHAEQARLLRGAILLRSSKYPEALEVLSRVMPDGELREPTLEFTGECLYRMGRLAEAEVVLRQLAAENANHLNAHRWLGSIYYDLGANDQALTELTIVARLAPADYRPHWLMGNMSFDFEQNRKAIEHYRKAIELTPPSAVRQIILRKLAKALIAEREYLPALKVLEIAPRDAEILAMISECHWSLGDRKRADVVLKQAQKKNADERAVLYLRARMMIGDGRPEAAIAPLRRILERNPRAVQSRYQLALVYRRLGRKKDAAAELARWKESKVLWEKLTKLNIRAIQNPSDADVRDELAEVCEKLGKHKLSTMWRKAAQACRALAGGKGSPAPSLPADGMPH